MTKNTEHPGTPSKKRLKTMTIKKTKQRRTHVCFDQIETTFVVYVFSYGGLVRTELLSSCIPPSPSNILLDSSLQTRLNTSVSC